MKPNSIPLDASQFNVDFLVDGPGAGRDGLASERVRYKVLIADDEEEVHRMSRMVLRDFQYDGHGVELLHAHSGKEAKDILRETEGIAVILLDVVMEEDDSGLKVVQYLREELKNSLTRIILRTGQPGKAPEDRVIVDYEINDYRTKTELSVQKLNSTLTVSLRAYRSLLMLEQHSQGLEKVLQASRDLFQRASFTDFLNGLLMQVGALADRKDAAIWSAGETDGNERSFDGLASVTRDGGQLVVAATGKFEKFIGMEIAKADYPVDLDQLGLSLTENDKDELVLLKDDHLVICTGNRNGQCQQYIVIEGDITHTRTDFIQIFLSNYALAIDNFLLNTEMRETQTEIICRFGDAIENRHNATGSHVRRVSEITRHIAKRLGFSDGEADSMAMASVMHDIGKMAIPDEILLKPGKLTPEQYDIMKGHTRIGHGIFRGSTLGVLAMAADIALHHHERFDGKGYPEGKRGGEISKVCEIVAVADVFDALISQRTYKEAWEAETVWAYFQENRGSQFAPDVVDALFAQPEAVMAIINENPA